MRYAICNELFEGWPWERVCEYAASLGYTGIEIAPFTLADHADEITPAKRQEIRQTARKHGMEIIGLHWLLVKPPGFYITSPDAAIRKMTCAYFRSLISLCADLGGNVLVIGSPKQRTLLPGVSRELAMQYAVEVFGGVMKEAMLREVVLAIEPLSPKLTDFLNTAEEGIELIQHINHPNFRLHLDVSAMQTEPTPIAQIIKASAKHLVHFHANDLNQLGPGMGENPIAYPPILKALKDVGYDGWLSVEAFDFRPGAEVIASESIRNLKRDLAAIGR